IDPLLSFGGADKHYIGTGPNVLGWGLAAAFGAKLARPDVPVVSVVGDGSFCFSGPQLRRDRARQARDRGRAALSLGHPHLSRRRRRGFELASALFGRGFAPAQGVTMRRLVLVGVLALVLGAATPLRAQTASALPLGEGRDLVATACSQCH